MHGSVPCIALMSFKYYILRSKLINILGVSDAVCSEREEERLNTMTNQHKYLLVYNISRHRAFLSRGSNSRNSSPGQ